MSENKKYFIYAAIVLAALGSFLFFGPPGLLHKTSTPEFCGLCHVMDKEYDMWLKTGLHRGIKCVDCHLPNNNMANHLLWKGIDGMKDVIFFYGRIYSDEIRATSHAKNTIRKNCFKCHNDMVSRAVDEERNCWECHRRVNHTFPQISFMGTSIK